MNKVIIKKITLMIILMISFFVLIPNQKVTAEDERDLTKSSSWQAEDLSIDVLNEVSYQSNYAPFEQIIDHPELVDINHIYVIEKATDLYHLSRLSKGIDQLVYLSLHYVLGNDIDYYEAVLENIDYRFHPIGFNEPFNGIFDGQGFEITNLYFQTILDEETYELEYQGLRYFSMFSKIGASGQVKNFGLINPIMIQPIEWGILSYASYVAGENLGLISHVYVLDYRKDASGMHVDGAFHLAGLVSINEGVIEDLYISSFFVRSRAVTHALSVSPVITLDNGLSEHIYYDKTLYSDTYQDVSFQGLTTLQFQHSVNFSHSWYFNDAYLGLAQNQDEETQVMQSDIYPKLHGLNVVNYELMIDDAVDFLVMQELLQFNGFFRKATYTINADIDMSTISKDAYQAPKVSFDGLLKSNMIDSNNTLFDHQPTDGGASIYYSIFHLNLNHPTMQYDYATWGIFSVLFGHVENLNLRRTVMTINPSEQDFNQLKAGVIAGEMKSGSLHNVHVDGSIIINSSDEIISSLSLGGLVGKASGDMNQVSFTGSLTGQSVHSTDQFHLNEGSIIGEALDLTISHVLSDATIEVIHSIGTLDAHSYVGGIMGYGENIISEKIHFNGTLLDSSSELLDDTRYLSGIYGFLTGDIILNEIYQSGVISYQPTGQNMFVSGITSLDLSQFEASKITHDGLIQMNVDGITILEEERSAQSLNVTQGIYSRASTSEISGLFNLSSIQIDLSFVDNYAQLLINDSSVDATLFHVENKGNLTVLTSSTLTHQETVISMIAQGMNTSLSYIRNEGDLHVLLTEQSSTIYPTQKINFVGILDELSDYHDLKDVYQGGNMNIETLGITHFTPHVQLSGIVIDHKNTAFSIERNIDPISIEFDATDGPLHNILQTGNLTITGSFLGDLHASGILYRQKGLLTQAINLGDIKIINYDETNIKTASSSGISNYLIGKYASIFDSVNSGDIIVNQMSAMAFAHSSGIANRNDLNWNLEIADPLDQNHLAKIAFSMNHGDVYAWSESVEDTYTITDETKTKAAAILTMGVLSVINNVNYGDIYGKYLVSGMIGFLPLNHFGTLQPNEVFIANFLQYGRVRAISSYDWVESSYAIDYINVPLRTTYNAYGAVVGKIHTGTQNWAFAGDVTYPIDRIYFGYLINIDDKVSMFANAPELSSSWADGFGNLQEANDVILNMLAYMGTTHPSDQSKEPFTYFYQGGWVGQYMGKVIDYYTLSEDEGGIFNESYAFRSTRPIYKGTDQYIHDYIAYIERDKVNPERLTALEEKFGQTLPGIYALASSEGIGQGIFMPDNLDIAMLHPYDLVQSDYDLTWLGTPDDTSSISYKLYVELRQIYASFAATIYDLEVTQMDQNGQIVENGLTLSSPVIDQTRKLITYYLPSNATILNQTTSSLMDVYRYIEVSEGLGKKVADVVASGEQTYSWVGDYKKVGDDFVEIGPYHTTGTVMLSTDDTTPVESYSRGTPVYSQTALDQATLPNLFKHTPHTYILFFWYASGYLVNATTNYSPGYGAYEAYTLSGYPTLYKYVGPSQEPVTYIQTDVETDVTIFDESTIYFGVDLSSSQNEISSGASLEYEGISHTSAASVPRSYGVYEAMYDANGNYLDSVQDHYGHVRVYSMSYDPIDPKTYQDYEIRVIRTADQSVTSISSLLVDGIDALPTTYDYQAVVSTKNLDPIDKYQTGSLLISYQTLNIADLQLMTHLVHLKDLTSLDAVDMNLYDVDQSMVETLNAFDNKTGSWGSGTVTIELKFYEDFPSGSYQFSLDLITGDTYTVTFDKTASNFAKVNEITYQGLTTEQSDQTRTDLIPYGIFYDSNLSETTIVDFSNLSTLQNIDYLEVKSLFPHYLDAIELSMFSEIVSIDLVIDMVDEIRHRYQIIYNLMAEDGTLSSFTHVLIEAMPDVLPKAIYVNGSYIPYQDLSIGYNEAPTIRLQYDFDLTFIHTTSPLTLTSSFVPYDVSEEAILGADYVMNVIDQIGYDVDFIKETPIGTYQTTLTYQQQAMIWDQVITWDFTYQTITYHKLLNDQSMLENIYFVSDQVFQGFNTIIDSQPISIERYEYLLLNPQEREIVQLPTTGILYQEYSDLPNYYVIGQVQQTQLTYFAPTLMIPDGATIKRVVDPNHNEAEYQSDDLYADYSPISSDFQFVQYRIYAMDYEQNPTNYTDYYIAVQDMTNMIRFDITILNDAAIPIDQVYLSISVCQNGEENLTCDFGNEILKMGMFSTYEEGVYQHHVLQTTTYGAYKIDVDLPQGYTYHIDVLEVVVIGNAFYIENSIFPRKVYMTLTITDDLQENPWGNQHNFTVSP